MFDEDDSGLEENQARSPESGNKKIPPSTSSGFFGAKFASRTLAIKMVNPARMHDKAHRVVFGRTVLPRFRRPLMWLVALQAKYFEHLPAAKLHAAVVEANETSAPTARAQCRFAVDLGLISAVFDEEDPKTVTNYYLSDEQFEKLALLDSYLDLIPAVVAAQLADPYNPVAGAELLPASVYDNIIDQFDDPEATDKSEGLK